MRDNRSQVTTLLEEIKENLKKYPEASLGMRVIRRMIRHATTFKERIYLKSVAKEVGKRNSLELAISILDARMPLITLESENQPNEGKVNGSNLQTYENILDMDGATSISKSAGKNTRSDGGAVGHLNLGDFLKRPVRILDTTLPLGAITTVKLDVWDLFTLDPTVRSKLRNFAYFKGNMQVRIVISGMPFHAGRVLVSYQPYADYNQALGYIEAFAVDDFEAWMCYLSQAPGAFTMDVKDNSPRELTLPFISPKPMHDLFNRFSGVTAAGTSFNDMAEAGTLYISTLNAPTSVASTPTDVLLTVYAWCDDPELGCGTSTQMAITTESDERKTGPIENVASSAATVSKLLTNVPVIGPYMKASQMMASGIGSFAALMGWSKPIMLPDKTTWVKNMGYRNGAQLIGYDTNYQLSMDPQRELNVSPDFVGANVDDSALGHLAQIPSFFTSFNWQTTDTSAAAIFRCNVTPLTSRIFQDFVGDEVVQPTAISFAATPFSYWRGSIKYRLEIVASAYHRGKFEIRYEPNIDGHATTAGSSAMNKQFIKIIDIQETQDIEFVIEWANQRPWLICDPQRSVYTPGNVLGLSSSQITQNGFFTITPFTTLQSPTAEGVKINVYISCDDLELNFPSSQLFPTIRTESMCIECESNNSNDIPRECFTLNPGTYDVKRLTEDYFGEKILSLRALLKRYTHAETTSISASAVPYVLLHETTRDIPNQVQYGTTGKMDSLFSYMKYAYLGYRGATRHRYYIPGLIAGGDTSQWRFSNERVTPTAPVPTNTPTGLTTTNGMKLEGSINFVPKSNGGIEIETPYYSTNLFNFSFNSNPTVAEASENNYVRGFEFHVDLQPHIATKLIHDMAAGEDFTFLRFQGGPGFRI